MFWIWGILNFVPNWKLLSQIECLYSIKIIVYSTKEWNERSNIVVVHYVMEDTENSEYNSEHILI